MKHTIKILFVSIGIILGIFSHTDVKAASQKSWQSVYVEHISSSDTDFIHYVKYGKISIARCYDKLYVKNGDINKKVKIKPAYLTFGGVITNGKDVMYQYGKNIYLLKNLRTKIKVATLKSRKNIFLGKYGNSIIYGKQNDYDGFIMYKFNLKSKKITNLNLKNGFYLKNNYIVYNGQFHEGVYTEMRVYNLKNKKNFLLDKKGGFGVSAVIDNGNVYYVKKLNDTTNKNKIVKYNIKTKKKTVIKKNVKDAIFMVNPNHYYYSDEKYIYFCDIKSEKKVKYLL